METMVEKVARAIWPDDFNLMPGHENCVDCLEKIERRKAQARTAIQAIRKPSTPMKKAGADTILSVLAGPMDAEHCWRAMIDAALDEGRETEPKSPQS